METLLSTVLTVAQEVMRRVESVQANCESCATLTERIRGIVGLLVLLRSSPLASSSEASNILAPLQTLLEEISAFITKFEGRRKILKFIFCDGNSETLSELNGRLDRSLQSFQLLLSVDGREQERMREQLRAREALALRNDLTRLMAETREEVAQQGDSTREQVQQTRSNIQALISLLQSRSTSFPAGVGFACGENLAGNSLQSP